MRQTMSFEQYTNQTAFNAMVTHLASMSSRSGRNRQSTFDCKYRGKNNAKCVVGALIPDELYDPNMDGSGELITTVDMLLEIYPKVRNLFVEEIDVELLYMTQMAHDLAANWNQHGFENLCELKLIAKEFNLDDSILNKVTWVANGC